jgi:hypothetical protein
VCRYSPFAITYRPAAGYTHPPIQCVAGDYLPVDEGAGRSKLINFLYTSKGFRKCGAYLHSYRNNFVFVIIIIIILLVGVLNCGRDESQEAFSELIFLCHHEPYFCQFTDM